MVWVRDHPLRPRQLGLFTFRIEDTSGTPVTDLDLYMGMPGHAIFISKDRQVFAHVHPSGSVSPIRSRLDEAGSRITRAPAPTPSF